MIRMRHATTATICAALLAIRATAELDITWSTIDGGGGTSSGGGFVLTGTIGQHDAGSHASPMTGGNFSLVGGFWQPQGSDTCGQCPGDLNGSHDVTLTDLATLLSNFGLIGGMTCADGDIQPNGGDGDVDLSDLALLLANFGTVCP